MNGYSWVSGISIFCYLFFLLSIVSSKRKVEGAVRSFVVLLIIMLLWTGGSIGMRLQFWPGVNFWHHVSLLGMMLLAVGYYQFLEEFLDERGKFMRLFLFCLFIALFILNCFTGVFIPLPEVISEGGELKFLYHYKWPIALLGLVVVFALLQIAAIVRRFCRGNRIALRQLSPVIAGVLIIFLGNVLATLPIFVGLPIDMLSGVVNAIFLFYALYKKKLFPMTILLSKTNYVILAMIIGCVIFSDVAHVLLRVMQYVGLAYITSLIIAALFLLGTVLGLYFIINTICDKVFSHAEKKRQRLLNRFAEEITHMLDVDGILQLMSDTVQQVVDVNRLFILVHDIDGNYRIEKTNNPLDEKNFYFRADHPLIQYFKSHKGHVMFQDFVRKTVYKSMWESEKTLLINQHIECMIPMSSGDELVGCILLSGKPGKAICTDANIKFLQSAADICSEAVSNAYLYERALEEAQKDELTGLVNSKFFFEILEHDFEKYRDYALSLCLINIDNFKLFNQMYGTHEGDLALQRVATLLASAISGDAHAARIKGDEFALILPGYDIYSAKCLADNIAEQISNISSSESTGSLTVSIGICAAPYMASSARELYRNTDNTVYAIKRTGKNSVQIYSEDIDRRIPVSSVHKSGYSENAGTIYALTAAIDAKDHYTFKHSQNVAYYAAELAKAADMTPDLVEIVREAGLLHDIGKIGVREEILNKPAKLTAEEFEAMKAHVENAVNIVRHLPALDYVIPAVLSHHEHYDGRGYPRRLAGDNIPITGRILCIADSFDAITSERNYKAAVPVPEAIAIMRSEAGKQFDPYLVDIFIDHLENGQIQLQASPAEEAAAQTSHEEDAALLTSGV